MVFYRYIKNRRCADLDFFEEQNHAEEQRGAVYHTGSGFFRPYVEPLWKKEKRMIRNSANGIGFASLAFVLLSLFSGVFLYLFVEVIYPAANIHGNIYVTETTEWAFTLLSYVLSLLLPFGIYALCLKMPIKVALPFKKAKTDLTVGGVFIALGVSVLAAYLVSFLQIGLEYVGIGITMPEYEIPKTVPGLVFYFLSLAVAPAFVEEIICRGIIMQNLRRFGDIFALVISSIIFGILHMNLVQAPYAFVMGLAIGYFVMRTGSLWVGVIIHFINNSVASVFEVVFDGKPIENYVFANDLYNLISIILAVIAIIYVLAKYKDMLRFEPSRTVLSSGKKIRYFFTAPGLILLLVVSILMTAQYVYFI